MFRMNVQITTDSDLFTVESLEFLKEYELYDEDEERVVKHDGQKLYELVTDHIEDPTLIDIPVWDVIILGIKPEVLFSVLIAHFKPKTMSITVEGDPEYDYGLPDGYGTPYYSYDFHLEEYEPEDINETFYVCFDADCLFAYNYETEESVNVCEIDGVDAFELY